MGSSDCGWEKGTPRQGAALITEPLITEPWQSDEAVQALCRGLAGYLSAVAKAIGVPEEGTSFEVSDTATAYLALDRKWPGRPGRDLMLVWCERMGWTVSLETGPAEPAMVLARLGGDSVPEPQAVAQFVTDALAEDGIEPLATAAVSEPNRLRLAESLTRYAIRS
ncbi:DUF6292 family protein [Actinocrispum sp. NPDC049592]|uniref:DUF6292 family protein n=1 Tax=Actinocrispum sp. NPDC049592 TaxID=3154835 RepID=UPI003442456D